MIATNFTLVGNGGHAVDILATGRQYHRILDSHDPEPPREWVVIGINDPQLRAKVAAEMHARWCFTELEWVHPTAFIGPDCTIGTGTHINYAVSMTRTTLGHHCTVSPGVTICGDVTVGDRVFIGAGAVIRNLVTIGSDAFIRMGARVTRDVAPGERF